MKEKNKLTGRQVQERYEWIVYLYNKGYSYGEIAQLLSTPLSRQRVQQIIVGGRPDDKVKIIKQK